LTAVQTALLVGVGLQHKTVDDMSRELDVPVAQLLALHNKCMHKVLAACNRVCTRQLLVSEPALAAAPTTVVRTERATRVSLLVSRPSIHTVCQCLLFQDDLAQAADTSTAPVVHDKLQQYAVRGSADEWAKALVDGDALAERGAIVSVKHDATAADGKVKRKISIPEQPPVVDKKRKKTHNKSAKKQR
jgi:N-acetyltransferase 10